MKYAYIGIIFILQLIGKVQIFGQKDLFTIGGTVGVNFSELPFEKISNNEIQKHHNGFNAGIFCNADLNRHLNLKMEMNYSGNGAYIKPETFPIIEYSKIKLNHIEVPFHLDFYINSFKSTNFLPEWTIEVGGAYARLFSYRFEDMNGIDVTDQVAYDYQSTILTQIGTSVYFAKHFGVNVRYSMVLVPLDVELDLNLTFRLIYML